jgi:REase_AHJR-like
VIVPVPEELDLRISVEFMSDRNQQTPLEHRRVLGLAREYKQKGYNVTVYPSPSELPPALAKCSFDLIAADDGKVIAVEVRTRESLTLNGPKDLRSMADSIQQIPGWEFELVVTNPRKK